MSTIRLTDTIDITQFPTSDEETKYYLPEIGTINPKDERTYHSQAIQKKARVSAIQIGHWTKTGIIIPVKTAKGTGKMHVYGHQNLIEAMICRELSQYSINYGVMREVLDFLRGKQWLFDIYSTDINLSKLLIMETGPEWDEEVAAVKKSIANKENTRIKRHHTIWEYFKLYPQTETISLVLWKDSISVELSEPKKGEYSMHVITTLGALEIISRCQSSILINLTHLFSEAGSFYEEAEK